MRSKEDLEFSSICDRVGRAKITKEDEEFLRSIIQKTDIEDSTRNAKQLRYIYFHIICPMAQNQSFHDKN